MISSSSRNKKHLGLSLIFLLLMGNADARDCNAPVATCATAELIKRDIVKGLPQKVSQNMTITHVARDNVDIHMYVQLSYDLNYLASSIRSKGASIDDARRAMQVQAQNYFCSDPKLKTAIAKGIGFYNHYKLSDGQAFVITEVKRCDD